MKTFLINSLFISLVILYEASAKTLIENSKLNRQYRNSRLELHDGNFLKFTFEVNKIAFYVDSLGEFDNQWQYRAVSCDW